MEIDKRALGRRIKQIRIDKAKTTMEGFANLIDSGKSNVSRWERGENIPNDLTLKKIADIGDISVEELLYGNFKTRIKGFLLNEPDTDEKFIEYTINYFNNTNEKYPSRERVIEVYNEIHTKVMEEIKDSANKKVSELLLGYNVYLANKYLTVFLNDPEEDKKYDFIKLASEELLAAAEHYEKYFNKSIDESFQEAIDIRDK